MQVIDVLDDLFQSCIYCKTSIVLVFALKYVKCHTGIRILRIKITVAHCHFIKIHYHGQISLVVLPHVLTSFLC